MNKLLAAAGVANRYLFHSTYSKFSRAFFCHVPKTAGTSIHPAVRRAIYGRFKPAEFALNLGADKSAAYTSGQSLFDVRKVLLSYFLSQEKFKFGSGHFYCPPEISQSEVARDWRFLTILRDPVERFISLYIYNRYKDSALPGKHDIDFDVFLDRHGEKVGSEYIRWFSGSSDISDDSIQVAIDNIRSFSVYGCVEDMPSWCARFESVFSRPIRIRRSNSTPKPGVKEQIKGDPVLMSRIRKCCEPDYAVYNAIRNEK